MDLVADASVIVKWFLHEEGRAKALRLRDDFVAQDVQLHVPEVLPFEVLNALRFSSRFDEAACLQAQVVLDGYGFRRHVLVGEFARRAVHVSYARGLPICDASYMALAKLLGLKVITADDALARAVGRDAISIEDYVPLGP
ncbi:MAG TPA: type II toxin-antitoxin system VapC family toxin [Thermoplasmata archaeon]|nr:type II toxin-antitoxin system VapC family toxin [Thermoplasmata archaeon]